MIQSRGNAAHVDPVAAERTIYVTRANLVIDFRCRNPVCEIGRGIDHDCVNHASIPPKALPDDLSVGGFAPAPVPRPSPSPLTQPCHVGLHNEPTTAMDQLRVRGEVQLGLDVERTQPQAVESSGQHFS